MALAAHPIVSKATSAGGRGELHCLSSREPDLAVVQCRNTVRAHLPAALFVATPASAGFSCPVDGTDWPYKLATQSKDYRGYRTLDEPVCLHIATALGCTTTTTALSFCIVRGSARVPPLTWCRANEIQAVFWLSVVGCLPRSDVCSHSSSCRRLSRGWRHG